MAWSLWLSPTPALHARLTGVILDLARRHGTTAFEPHVTLLGGIEGSEDSLSSGARRLAARLGPFEIRLGAVGTGTELYHCVYVAVAETPELMRAHALARETFGLASDQPFRPHLSLVYGRLGQAEKDAAGADAGVLAGSFGVDALQVMDTRGEVSAWRRLASVRLTSS